MASSSAPDHDHQPAPASPARPPEQPAAPAPASAAVADVPAADAPAAAPPSDHGNDNNDNNDNDRDEDHEHEEPDHDHDSDATDDHAAPDLAKPPPPPADADPAPSDPSLDAFCVVCFERPPNVTLDPCGHSNLCDVCVSRLVKRRCPTCRARARKVTIRYGDHHVTKAVREVIAERKQRETRVLEETLQIVFLGPEKVGKKTLARKLIAKYPLVSSPAATASSVPDDDDQDTANSNAASATANSMASSTTNATAAATAGTTGSTSADACDAAAATAAVDANAPATADADAVATSTTAPAAPAEPAPPPDVFSDGTDFSPNATIAGANVRLTVLRRTTLASRRMVLDDVRVLKPDVLVLCCSAHVGATFDSILAWDKVLRNNFQKPRVWALLALDEDAPSSTAPLDTPHDVSGAINAIFPADLRPKGHYFCSLGETFSVGFRSLAKDMLTLGRNARDEELAASIALEVARTIADQEAAGTLGDPVAANLVIANNGITMPSSSSTAAAAHARPTSTGRSGGGHVGRGFSLRALRERGGNGQGISLSGLVSWLAGSHES